VPLASHDLIYVFLSFFDKICQRHTQFMWSLKRHSLLEQWQHWTSLQVIVASESFAALLQAIL